MRRLVDIYRRDPTVLQTARQIMISYGVPRDDTEAEIRALYWFLSEHIRYTKDPVDVEMLQDPLVTLSIRNADCDDLAVLAASLAESIGIPARFVLFAKRKGLIPHHIFVELQTKKGWIAIDTVWNKGAGIVPPGVLETV
jgi:hypothetical protein